MFSIFTLIRGVVKNSYEALAAMHGKSRDDREKDEAAGILSAGATGEGSDTAGAARAEREWAARAKRLRDKNEPCVLPDRLLHRVRTVLMYSL